MAPESVPRSVWQNLRVLVPIGLLQALFYLTLNHWQLRPAQPLPLSVVDEWIPFWPWTVFPYMGFFLGALPIALSLRDDRVFQTAILAYFYCLAMTIPFFLFWPTACPRPELSPSDAGWDDIAFRWLMKADTPACSFPSMHVMLPTIVCWAVWKEGRSWAGWYIAAMLALSLTVLTTKQHYAWDWLGGLVIALIALWAADRRMPPVSDFTVSVH